MDFKELARKRRKSVRNFKSDDISEELITELLETAIHAPTAGNVQPWKFKVVRSKSTKQQLAGAALNQSWMVPAPVIIVVMADLDRAARSYGKRGVNLYALQDTAAAIQNLLLAAAEQGIASCWIGAFDEEKVVNLFNLPSYLRPVALIPLGYPAEEPISRPRRPLNEVVEWE